MSTAPSSPSLAIQALARFRAGGVVAESVISQSDKPTSPFERMLGHPLPHEVALASGEKPGTEHSCIRVVQIADQTQTTSVFSAVLRDIEGETRFVDLTAVQTGAPSIGGVLPETSLLVTDGRDVVYDGRAKMAADPERAARILASREEVLNAARRDDPSVDAAHERLLEGGMSLESAGPRPR